MGVVAASDLNLYCFPKSHKMVTVQPEGLSFAHIQIKINNISIELYQSPLILTKLFQHNLINVSYLTACYLYQVMMTLHFLNDVAYDA